MKKYLYVPSGKSETGAILLGGMVFAIISIFGVGYFSWQKIYSFVFHISPFSFTIAAVLLTALGYYDDKFEVRARYKLLFQFLILFIYTKIAIELPHPYIELVLEVLYTSLALVILNGTNLLDGLDTLSYKIALATYAQFLLIGYFYESQGVFYLSMIFMMPNIAFYFYNKFPSKIHLGEIGSTMYGLAYISVASTMFMHLEANTRFTVAKNIILATLPLMIFFVEVWISFTRRLIAKTAPFAGDKLHFHYILRDFYKLHDRHATTVYALVIFIVGAFSFCIVYVTDLIYLGVICSICLFLVIEISLSYKYWFPKNTMKHILVSDNLESIDVVSNELFQDFEIDIIENKKELKKDEDA